MSVKASLTLVLKANDVVVAESKDPTLWQAALDSITSGSPLKAKGQSFAPSDDLDEADSSNSGKTDRNHLAKFAAQIGITTEQLEGACGPSQEPPYLHLEAANWESFKNNTPQRGKTSVSPIQLAGTMLALWFRHLRLGESTQAQVQDILKQLGTEDKNPTRGIKNCRWLSARPGGKILVNPAELSTARRVAVAFCTKKPISAED